MLKDYARLPPIVHVLCLGALINRAGSFIVPFITLYLTEQLKCSEFFATLAIGTFGLGSMMGSLIGGQVADRIGRKPVMIAAVAGSAMIILLFSTIRVAWPVPLVTFTLALVADAYRPAMSAMLSDIVPPTQRAHAFGLMYVAINLGFAIAPALAGTLADYSFTWLFVGDAATSLAFASIILLAIPESLGRGAVPGAAMPAAQAGFWASLGDMVRDRVLMTVCTAAFLIGVVYTQALSTLPLHMKALGLTKQQYGTTIAWNGGLIFLLQFLVTAVAVRYDRGRMLALGAVLTALGFGLTEWARVPWEFILTLVVWTLGEMIHAPLLSPVIADIAPVERRARYMGMLSLSFAAAHTVGAPLGGACLELLGANAIWRSSFAVAGAAAVLYMVVRKSIVIQRGGSASSGGS